MKLCSKTAYTIAAIFMLHGCAASWIEGPSAQTRNLVHDLKLEGYECKAGRSEIVCTQINPMLQSSPALCSAEEGCIEQPSFEVRNVYIITERGSGIPSIRHQLDRKPAKS